MQGCAYISLYGAIEIARWNKKRRREQRTFFDYLEEHKLLQNAPNDDSHQCCQYNSNIKNEYRQEKVILTHLPPEIFAKLKQRRNLEDLHPVYSSEDDFNTSMLKYVPEKNGLEKRSNHIGNIGSTKWFKAFKSENHNTTQGYINSVSLIGHEGMELIKVNSAEDDNAKTSYTFRCPCKE